MTDLVEIAAEAMWGAESMRTRGVPRSIYWIDTAEKARDAYRHSAAAVLSALREAGAIREWKPISDEQKDGSEILIHATLHYYSWKYPAREVSKAVLATYDETNELWKGPCPEDEDDTAWHYKATLFQPLPQPPEER